jgi:hypothetical protein
MGATDAVNAVEGVLTQKEKDQLLNILENRKKELQEALLDVHEAIGKLLKAGATPTPPTS